MAKFPIRAKLLLMMSGLVLSATVAYLVLAVKIFKDDKTQLVYELNASGVKTLAAETQAVLQKFADKAQLLTQGHASAEWTQTIFEGESDLVSYTLYRSSPSSSSWETVASSRPGNYLKLYGLGPSEIEKIREQIPVPFSKVLTQRIYAWNSTLPSGAPILTLALAVQIKGTDVPHVAVVDIRSDHLLKRLEDRGIATVYVIDGEGRVVAHPDATVVSQRAVMGDVEIVREAVDSPVGFQMKRFQWKGVSWLGAYSAVGIGGLFVISQVEEKQAYQAAARLISKTLILALIVITAAILVSGWLARSLTLPLDKLVQATQRLAHWDFSETVTVKTRDEVADLASAFNSMADDIRRQHAEIQKHQLELEDKVKERTASLEKEKRRAAEAQDALLRTTRLASLGELAGVAAHEILNPVNNMQIRIERGRTQVNGKEGKDFELLIEIISSWKKAYAQGGWKCLQEELLRPADDGKPLIEEDFANIEAILNDQKKKAGDRDEDADFLIREIAKISRLLNNMRSLSRVSGERKCLSVYLPLEDTVATLSDLMEKNKITVVLNRGTAAGIDDAPNVIADKDELVQVFSNLMRNSLHAISKAGRRAGEIRVDVSHVLFAGQKRVEVRVTDNGSGIAEENRSRIFESQFTTKTLEEGTGLGLSISRRLVRAFNGDLELEKTVEGVGTTFLVWFPAAEGEMVNSKDFGNLENS